MANLIGKMLDHPFATMLVFGATANSVANIIGAIKGKPVNPFINIINIPTQNKA